MAVVRVPLQTNGLDGLSHAPNEFRMSEDPTQFQPTYALDAADTERPLSWMNLRKLLVLLVFMAAVPLMVVELLSSQREQDVELRARAREH